MRSLPITDADLYELTSIFARKFADSVHDMRDSTLLAEESSEIDRETITDVFNEWALEALRSIVPSGRFSEEQMHKTARDIAVAAERVISLDED